jgi:streptogramin lyase
MRPVEESSSTVFGSIIAAPDGAVWVTIDTTSTDGNCCPPADPAAQVARFDGHRWKVFGTADGLPSDNVGLSLAVGPDGTAWLSTTRGLFRLDGKRWSPALGDEYLGRMSVAVDGTLWFSGGSGVGVGRISAPAR